MSNKTKKNSDFTVHFAVERKTKGAVRYLESAGADDDTPISINDGAKVGILYVRKSAFRKGKFPERLTVRIRPDRRR
jgi:hypothetical protein